MTDPQPPAVAPQFDHELGQLYRKVCLDHQRVEVSLPDGQCVIISKDELEALERALEILADGDGLKRVCQSIEHLCESCRAPQA